MNKIFPMEVVVVWRPWTPHLLVSSFTNVKTEDLIFVSLATVAHGGTLNPPPTLTAFSPQSPSTLTSGVGAAQMGLFWYISQIEITSSPSWIHIRGSVDTPFHIVNNIRISSSCPGVLQNYIPLYIIKSDWPRSAFPPRLSWITVRIYPAKEQTAVHGESRDGMKCY